MGQSPVKFSRCLEVYKIFEEEAQEEPVLEYENRMAKVWTGRTTQMFVDRKLAQPTYTPVLWKLRAMGCIQQLSRGGGGQPSRWLILYPPTQELFDETPDRPNSNPTERDINRSFRSDLTTFINALVKRVEELEVRNRVLTDSVIQLSDRMDKNDQRAEAERFLLDHPVESGTG